MKRILSSLAVAILLSSTMIAEPTRIILDLRTNHGTESEHQDPPRAPMRVPSLYIEGHTLSFSSACIGYTLEFVKDDEVIYTYFIQTDDDLVLPDYLSGQFEVRLVGASFTFVGEIEL